MLDRFLCIEIILLLVLFFIAINFDFADPKKKKILINKLGRFALW